MDKIRSRIVLALMIAALAIGAALIATDPISYRVKFVMPSAAQLVKGSPVWINGVDAGSVENLTAENGKAVVEAVIDNDYAPLHEGTTTWIQWYSAVGQRVLQLRPGPPSNAEIASDSLYVVPQTEQIEVDQVLAELDPPTRARLSSLVKGLSGVVDGREQQIKASLRSAGPTVENLSTVLKEIGKDGPAIHELVRQLNELTAVAASRHDDVAGSVRNINGLVKNVAAEQENVSAALKELPPTLSKAQGTLGKVPDAVDATTPVLDDLRPGTERLPSLARNLNGTLSDLRPALRDLRPVLEGVKDLLGQTPRLLDNGHAVLPPLKQIVEKYQPAVSFIRPYTPELTGFIGNFGLGFSSYDAAGHYWNPVLAPSPDALNEHVVNPPLSNPVRNPAPGQVVNQPWTDAAGSGER